MTIESYIKIIIKQDTFFVVNYKNKQMSLQFAHIVTINEYRQKLAILYKYTYLI